MEICGSASAMADLTSGKQGSLGNGIVASLIARD
jgi:hypothetical protein